ncbi:hypothetical protein CAPTEDRAFT_160455 [Capitella teleta]|uniref:AMP-dependent synthetase/ligase domain-containing protein n=1 Tax=Capitella teleta TaxID=283909 RepID=R7UYE8_CAPTE|nr:hypothetical protein CAPTEDRAFT_160455 [Capitella teleta]|eukprot:ELU11292.1 hypothetical protein CAPTEDRAFT_160455 [Capitella teleta]
MIDRNGCYTYASLKKHTHSLNRTISEYLNGFSGQRIAYLCPHDATYVVTQNAIWQGKGVAVPLSPKHPTEMLSYFMKDSGAELLIAHADFSPLIQDLKPLGIPVHVIRKEEYLPTSAEQNNGIDDDKHEDKEPAVIVYTSGTTGPPKGVVQTHGSLSAMVQDQVSCWGWTADDVILHVLPLHHVHGIVNTLHVPLTIGATCVMMEKFQVDETWKLLLGDHSWTPLLPSPINVFMAVPTVYAMLLQGAPKNVRDILKKNFRLMVSGSASLPLPIMQQWEEVSGHRLLERYGMTETGMVLTNPLNGERLPGAVGQPFPSVKVCIADPSHGDAVKCLAEGDSDGTTVHSADQDEIKGELLVKGPTVFTEYWGKESATQDAFTDDGWFRTGDTVSYENGVYRIMGRTSVDIIKSAGYKISALDIERHLLAHPRITDCAVVGLDGPVYGQKIAAVIVLNDEDDLELQELNEWLSERTPVYQLPRQLKILDVLPRSLIGKVNKKELVREVFGE